MKLKFRIVGVQSKNEHVILELEPLESKLPHPEKVIEPKFKSEEARVGYQMGKAILQGMMSTELSMMRPGPPGSRPTVRQTRNLILGLTQEEYRVLGEPTVNRTVTLTISLKIE